MVKFKEWKKKIQRHSVIGFMLVGILVTACMPFQPAKAAENSIYVSSSGAEGNTGLSPDSPLNSLNSAGEMLPDGGMIVVTETIRITSSRSYSMNSGIIIKADESLTTVFEIEKGAELTLNNIVITGSSNQLIKNYGILKIGDGVAFKVAGAETDVSGAVVTDKEASTYKNESLVAGVSQNEKSEQEEKKTDTEKESESPERETEVKKDKNDSENPKGSSEESGKADSGAESDKSQSEGVLKSETELTVEYITDLCEINPVSLDNLRSRIDAAGFPVTGAVTEQSDQNPILASVVPVDLQNSAAANNSVRTESGAAGADSRQSIAGEEVIVGVGALPATTSQDTSSGSSADNSNSAKGNAGDDTATGDSSNTSTESDKAASTDNQTNKTSSSASTGDSTNMIPVILSLICSFLAMVFAVRKKISERKIRLCK